MAIYFFYHRTNSPCFSPAASINKNASLRWLRERIYYISSPPMIRIYLLASRALMSWWSIILSPSIFLMMLLRHYFMPTPNFIHAVYQSAQPNAVRQSQPPMSAYTWICLTPIYISIFWDKATHLYLSNSPVSRQVFWFNAYWCWELWVRLYNINNNLHFNESYTHDKYILPAD